MEARKFQMSELSLDPGNVRLHSERNIETIMGSLRRFGQQKPIVIDQNSVIRAGNGTYEAARNLGWTDIMCVQTDLEGVEAAAYSLVDNRTAELAEWNFEGLSTMLKGLKEDDTIDLVELGWEQYELDALLNADWAPPELDEDYDPEADTDEQDLIIRFFGPEVERIYHAIEEVRKREEDEDMTDNEALVVVAKEWLSDDGDDGITIEEVDPPDES